MYPTAMKKSWRMLGMSGTANCTLQKVSYCDLDSTVPLSML